jgi:hypothetical protein
MNTGQQVFIYSASGLGLYLLFKAYHKIWILRLFGE